MSLQYFLSTIPLQIFYLQRALNNSRCTNSVHLSVEPLYIYFLEKDQDQVPAIQTRELSGMVSYRMLYYNEA
jgi:hypothetical protein